MLKITFIIVGAVYLCAGAFTFDETANIALCNQVHHHIPTGIFYPSSSTYNESLSSYFSGQEIELKPDCVFIPKNVSEVAEFVKLVGTASGNRHENVSTPQFAIRSGGHTPWSGAANIKSGITIDMRALNSLVLSSDRKVASLGGGAIWSDLYAQLDPYNVTLMGGRVISVGVGGYLTGGGISILSRQHGWSCDNIYGYEVVLATGEIVYATADAYSDLWLALKGGSNNFGIVTRFDVPTWPLGRLWGGALTFNYTPAIVKAHNKAFSNFMSPVNFDDAASMFYSAFYQSTSRTRSLLDVLFYAKEVTVPSIFDPFTSIPTPVTNTLRLANMSNIISEQSGSLPADADRAFYFAFSFRNPSANVYQEMIQAWENITNTLAGVESLEFGLLFQPHPVSNGTNSLGLPPGKTDLVLGALTSSYAKKTDDDQVLEAMQTLQVRIQGVLEREGVHIRFQYLNYAYKTQDPIGSYGPENKRLLQEVSRKYDPNGIFQTVVPGGFKLFA